jgi:hypothetical protein
MYTGQLLLLQVNVVARQTDPFICDPTKAFICAKAFVIAVCLNRKWVMYHFAIVVCN